MTQESLAGRFFAWPRSAEYAAAPSDRRGTVLKLGLLLILLGPMVPLHLPPWPSFHAEAVSIFGFGVVAVGWLMSRVPSPWPRSAQLLLALAAVPVVQAACGVIYFWGDAWTATAYLVLFALAIIAGASLPLGRPDLARFATGTVALAAIVSTGIAFDQWLRLHSLGDFAANVRSGARPFGNLGQPNQMATWLVLGLVSIQALHAWGRIRLGAALLANAFLVWGITMTQSRTGILEVVCITGLACAYRKRIELRQAPKLWLGASVLLVGCAVIWPSVNDSLLLNASRSLEQQSEGGVRLTHWATVIDAVGRHPWVGYGWNQTAVAQAQTAADHNVTEEQIDHAHNIAIDLLAWNGALLGGLLIAAVAWWLWRQFKHCRTGPALWALMAIAALLVHGMLEYPLEYAYFLLPLGLLIGALEQSAPVGRRRKVSWSANVVLFVAAAAFMAWMLDDYLEVEENTRIMRLEMAGFHGDGPLSAAPDVALLTQRREILRFARATAKRGMTAEELDWMRKISERFGYPPVLLRYAIGAGLNGQPQAAETALQRLCKTAVRERCSEGVDAWTEMAAHQFPELTRVHLPSIPPLRGPPIRPAS